MTTQGGQLSGQIPSQGLGDLIARAIQDPQFRQLLIDSPEQAIQQAGVQLTPQEQQAVVGGSREEREQMLQPLGDRAAPGTVYLHVWSVRVGYSW